LVFSSNDVVFFFGAGASAPFGIPTMKQFVPDFEQHLNENAEKKERELYADIKKILETKIHRPPDLEAIFTVIDGIINYDDPEKLGMLSLYFSTEFRKNFPNTEDVLTSKKLRQKFQAFIKEKCAIPETSYNTIEAVFKDFFNRFALETTPYAVKSQFAWSNSWTIFTTNYDTCLESYWCEIAGSGVDTNTDWDAQRKAGILHPQKILQKGTGEIKLFKLHGSISWHIDEKTNEVIELMERGSSLMGRKYIGELMLYPIAEKQLYVDPYISMLLRLNRELEEKNIWVVIGYSFNDPVIQEIFLKHLSEKKHLILVHPDANEVLNRKFGGTNAKLGALKKRFGLLEAEGMNELYSKVNHQIMHEVLGRDPRFKWHEFPKP